MIIVPNLAFAQVWNFCLPSGNITSHWCQLTETPNLYLWVRNIKYKAGFYTCASKQKEIDHDSFEIQPLKPIGCTHCLILCDLMNAYLNLILGLLKFRILACWCVILIVFVGVAKVKCSVLCKIENSKLTMQYPWNSEMEELLPYLLYMSCLFVAQEC